MPSCIFEFKSSKLSFLQNIIKILGKLMNNQLTLNGKHIQWIFGNILEIIVALFGHSQHNFQLKRQNLKTRYTALYNIGVV